MEDEVIFDFRLPSFDFHFVKDDLTKQPLIANQKSKITNAINLREGLIANKS